MPFSQTASAESAILVALDANNPFEKPPVVRAQNIWGESFPDVPSINAKASDTLFEAASQVREADSSLEKVTSIVFLADKGTGKSHVLKRIRRRLQAASEGVFIYASADKYGNPSLINLLFQQSIAESLEQRCGGVTQWQEIAALMVAEAVRINNPGAKTLAAKDLVAKFDKLYLSRYKQEKDLVGELVRAIRWLKPSTDVYLLRAIVWTLSEERGHLAVKWLAGEQLTSRDADELRLPENDKSEGAVNAAAALTIVNLVSLIAEYKSVIVCFDELDSSVLDESGYTMPFIIVNLVKRLFDSIVQSENAKGVVLLTSILPGDWRKLRSGREAAVERISAYCDPVGLINLNENNAKDLCALTLKSFYEKKGLVPPNSIYPFVEEEIAAFSKGRPSARETLQWFAKQLNEKLKSIEQIPLSPTERFVKAYQNALEQFSLEDLETNEVGASALQFCFLKLASLSSLKDKQIEGVVVRSVEEVTPKYKNNDRLQFKIVGEESGDPVVIGVGVMQETHGLSVGAGFRRLLDTETFGLSRGCLVRSRDRKIKRCWDSYEYYHQLIANGGEWVDLALEDIRPLLALQYVYEHHEKFDLTHKRLDYFAFTRDLLQNNPLIKEILSRPEGQVVEEGLEGEELQRPSEDISLEDLTLDLSQSTADDLVDDAEVQSEMNELTEALSA
ncbi:MAG: hypothetical protein DCF25_18395 [Leptolyngbya foveolarum]|uniref:Orc1-like AAA ATPase domain-containing protein n=1 Tax=Leptolyngbya foveolarum TaxID=47253 RepID=A0A2W4TS80_9CYAN|nr:MAG: hypothetical protein DCF25_18395 [Leptolyngbya foveolarum]